LAISYCVNQFFLSNGSMHVLYIRIYTYTREPVYNNKNYCINDDNSSIIRTEAFSRTVRTRVDEYSRHSKYGEWVSLIGLFSYRFLLFNFFYARRLPRAYVQDEANCYIVITAVVRYFSAVNWSGRVLYLLWYLQGWSGSSGPAKSRDDPVTEWSKPSPDNTSNIKPIEQNLLDSLLSEECVDFAMRLFSLVLLLLTIFVFHFFAQLNCSDRYYILIILEKTCNWS